jgi:ankyrin repeat protein
VGVISVSGKKAMGPGMGFLERWSGVGGGLVAVLILGLLWQLLQGGEDLEARDLRGRTPLIMAAETGDLQQVQQLTRRGVAIDAMDDCQWTAMMRAAGGGHQAILQVLLDEGAQINHLDKAGYSALMAAVINNHRETARLLIERGAALDVQSGDDGRTALMWAVRNRNADMVSLLLVAGADQNVKNLQGQTAGDLALSLTSDESQASGSDVNP